MSSLTCPGTVGTGDQKYDELKWESSIISATQKQQELMTLQTKNIYQQAIGQSS